MTDEAAVAAFDRRIAPMADLAEQAPRVTAAAHAMAVRFHAGGKLVVFGTGGASTDAQHVAVEFVHPVIVGKRALPAICLTTDAATVTALAQHDGIASIFSYQIRYLAQAADIALGICAEPNSPAVAAGLQDAKDLGMLTVALVGGGDGAGGGIAAGGAVDHLLTAHSADPRIVKEVHVTISHVLWELVHVFLEQPEALRARVVT